MEVDQQSWREYAADFDAMSDEEVEHERQRAAENLAEAESWLEAVASWEAAGRPRSKVEVKGNVC